MSKERDHVLARLAVAQSIIADAGDAVREAVSLFLDTEEDSKGEQRAELLEGALDSLGIASRLLETASGGMADDDFDPAEGEEDPDEDDEDDAEEEDEES